MLEIPCYVTISLLTVYGALMTILFYNKFSKIRRVLNSNEDCIICFCTMNNSEKINISLECGHSFHSDCIDTWYLNNPEEFRFCPVCRKKSNTYTNFCDGKEISHTVFS